MAPRRVKLLKDKIVVLTGQQFKFGVKVMIEVIIKIVVIASSLIRKL